MKKQNRQRDAWLLTQRETKEKLRNRTRDRRKHTNRMGRQAPYVNRFNEDQQKPVDRRREIELPESLDLEENYEETVTHLRNVRRAAERRFRLQNLRFDKIRIISPSAALVLASEIDRWNESMGGRLRADHDSWKPVVKQLLCEMGFFELLNLKRPVGAEKVINETFLPFMRGNVEERTNGGALAKQLNARIEKVAGREILKHLLFDGVTEAVTNVCHHAYPKSRKKKKRYRPWWMSAAYTRDTGTVTVSFYDHGLTIPATLPASQYIERWKHRLGLWNDGEKIRAAMTLGRSATGKAGRGKGLRNFLELITAHAVSKLRIISRNGVLTVRYSDKNRFDYHTATVETSLRGTLIEWQFVPTTEKKDSDDHHHHS